MSQISPPLLMQVAPAPDHVSAGVSSMGQDVWRSDAVNPADLTRFENALAPADMGLHTSRVENVSRPGDTLGDSILNSLGSLKNKGIEMTNEMVDLLNKGDLSPSEMLRVQFRLLEMNIELQTMSNMAHHGVEDVKTIMRGQ